jgi:hypothetical protein
MKTILVGFPEGVFDMILSLKGEMGESNSEVVRNIVIAYLSEQGFFSKMSIRGIATTKNKGSKEIKTEK